MKKIYWLVLLSICLFWIIVYLSVPLPLEVYEKEATANLTWNKVGIDVDSERFSFGYVPLRSNGTSTRSFTTKNNHPFPIKVAIRTKGNISPFLFASANDFVLLQNQTRKLNLTFVSQNTNLSKDQLPLFYSGDVIIEYFRVKKGQ